MTDQDSQENQYGAVPEDEFALAIANLRQQTEDEDVSNKPDVSHIRKDNDNDEYQPGPSGYSLRSTPKKKDLFLDMPQFETPKKGFYKKNIFQTPTKGFHKSVDSFLTNKSPRRKASLQKRITSSIENSDDESASKKRCKIIPKEDSEGTGCSDENRDNSEIDQALELKAGQVKMNAKNVKTLLRQVLTNPSVLNMFKDALELENEDSPEKTPQKDARQLEYEPMMTRAKVKDLLERVSVASPSKKPADGPSILDVDFAEEEEDDEYDPAKDEGRDSDDDETESMLSSRFSDFGSPCPRTPNTPKPLQDNKSAGLTLSMCQEPLSAHTHTPPRLVVNTNGDQSAAGHGSEKSVNTIALRTRSKLPLHSTSITDIENAFVAPDITPDMYYTNDDADWNQFLSTLYKQPEEAGTDDDGEANDPEFDYMTEAALEEEDAEEVQFNKPNKIPKKELNDLWDELNDLFEDEVLPYQAVSSLYDPQSLNVQPETYPRNDENEVFKTPFMPKSPPKCSNQEVQVESLHVGVQPEQSACPEREFESQHNICIERDSDSIVTSFQIELIKDQMRKYVQLLAQSFVMCEKAPEASHRPEFLLKELNYFCQKSVAGEHSVYNVCNLEPALDFVEKLNKKSMKEGNKVQGKAHFQVTEAQKLAIYKSPAFVYPHLLPTFKHVKKSSKQRSFLPSEDNLIALGIEQFRDFKDVPVAQLIQKFLIYREKEQNIRNRIDYLANRKTGENVVKFVCRNGRLPDYFPKSVVTEFVFAAPQHQDHSLLPLWCRENYSELCDAESSHPDTDSEMGEISECQSLPDVDKPVEDDFTTSSSLLPFTSTPQVDRVLAAHSKVSRASSEFENTSCTASQASEEQDSPQLSRISFGVSNLPTELRNGKGRMIVLPGATSSSLPVKGIFYPLESVNDPAQSDVNSIQPELYDRSQSALRVSSIHHQMRGATNAEEESPTKSSMKTANYEAPSPDLLAKTLISCGIGEDLSNLSPIPSETSVSSPVAPKYGKIDSTVRNLRMAFDASENRESHKLQDYVKSKISFEDKYHEYPGRKGKNQTVNQTHNRNKLFFKQNNDVRSKSLPVNTSKNHSLEKMKIKLSSSQTISVLSLKNFDKLPLLDKPKMNINGAEKTVSNVGHSSRQTSICTSIVPAENSSALIAYGENLEFNSRVSKAEVSFLSRNEENNVLDSPHEEGNGLNLTHDQENNGKESGHDNENNGMESAHDEENNGMKSGQSDENNGMESAYDEGHGLDLTHEEENNSMESGHDNENNGMESAHDEENNGMESGQSEENNGMESGQSEENNGMESGHDEENNGMKSGQSDENNGMESAYDEGHGLDLTHEEENNSMESGHDNENNGMESAHDEENNGMESGQSEENNGMESGQSEENNGMESGQSEENNGMESGQSEENNGMESGQSEENNGMESGHDEENNGMKSGQSEENNGMESGQSEENIGMESAYDEGHGLDLTHEEENNSMESGHDNENNGMESGQSEENNGMESGHDKENNGMESGHDKENNGMESARAEENNDMESGHDYENNGMKSGQSEENIDMESTHDEDNGLNSTHDEVNIGMESASDKENNSLNSADDNKNSGMDSAPEEENSGMDSAPEEENKGMDSAPEEENKGMDLAPKEENKGMDSAPEEENKGMDSAPKEENKGMDSAPEEEKKGMDSAPKEENKGMDSAPKEENKGMDLAPKEENNGIDLAPEEENKGMDLAPEEENKGMDLAPEEENKGMDLAPEEENSGMELAPEEENKGMDITLDEEDSEFDSSNNEENGANFRHNEENSDVNLSDDKENNLNSPADNEYKDCNNLVNVEKKTSNSISDNEGNIDASKPSMRNSNSPNVKENQTTCASSDNIHLVFKNTEGVKHKVAGKIISAKAESSVKNELCARKIGFEMDHNEDYDLSPNMSSGDSEVDQDEVDEIMASIVTFRYDSQDPTKSRKDSLDSSLMDIDNDISERKVEKENECHADYITAYFQRVKDLLETKRDRFERLLFLLSHLNIDHKNPFELYLNLTLMLYDHKDLVEDFGGLLLSFQAVLCRCTMSSHEHVELQKYLYDIQSTCDNSLSVETLLKWLYLMKEDLLDKDILREKLMVLFQASPGLVDKCCWFFLSQQSLSCQLSCIQNENAPQGAHLERKAKSKATEKKTSPRRKKEQDGKEGKNTHMMQNTQIKMCAKMDPDAHVSSEVAQCNSQNCRVIDSQSRKVEREGTIINTTTQPVIEIKDDILEKRDSKGMSVKGDKLSLHCESRTKQTSMCRTDANRDAHISQNKTSDKRKNSTKTSSKMSSKDQQEDKVNQSLPPSSLSQDLNQSSSLTQPIESAPFSSMPVASNASTLSFKHELTQKQGVQPSTKSTGHSSTVEKNPQPKVNQQASLKTREILGSSQAPSVPTQNNVSSSVSTPKSIVHSSSNSTLNPEKGTRKNITNTCSTIKDIESTKGTSTAQPLPIPLIVSVSQSSSPLLPVVTTPLPINTAPFQPRCSSIATPPMRIPVLFYIQPQKFASPQTTKIPIAPKDKSQKIIDNVNRQPQRNDVDFVPRKTMQQSASKIKKGKTKKAKSSPRKTKPLTISSNSLTSDKNSYEATKEKRAPLAYPQEVIKKAETSICSKSDVLTTFSDVEYDICLDKNQQVKPSSNKNNFAMPFPPNVVMPPTNGFECSNVQSEMTGSDKKNGALVEENLLNQTCSQIDIGDKTKQDVSNRSPWKHNFSPDASPAKSRLYNSPLKLGHREIPAEVFQNYLDTMSHGALDESMDPQFLQHIAHLLVSPNKHNTDSRTKFDLLAFIESSQLTHKDLASSSGFSRAASQFFNKSSSSVTGPVGFSQALKEHGIKKSPCKENDEDNDVCNENIEEDPKVKDKIATTVDDPELSKDEKLSSHRQDTCGNKLKEAAKSDVIDKDSFEIERGDLPEDLSPSVWTMELDEIILTAVVENEGVTESVIEKLQGQIPMKSITELTSRANKLVDLMQQDIENVETQGD